MWQPDKYIEQHYGTDKTFLGRMFRWVLLYASVFRLCLLTKVMALRAVCCKSKGSIPPIMAKHGSMLPFSNSICRFVSACHPRMIRGKTSYLS